MAYSDTACTAANLTGLDAPFYGGPAVAVPAGAEQFTFTRMGLANDSDPMCAQPEVGLLEPCAEVFLVGRWVLLGAGPAWPARAGGRVQERVHVPAPHSCTACQLRGHSSRAGSSGTGACPAVPALQVL